MDRATEAAAYTRKLAEIVADISATDLEISHPLLQSHESQENVIILVLTSNRGLCGGYNGGVLRQTTARLTEAQEAGNHIGLEVSGKRGLAFLKFQGHQFDQQFTHFEEKPTFEEVAVLADRYIDLYNQQKLDRLDVVYTQFLSASKQVAVLETLLPIKQLQTDDDNAVSSQASDNRIEYEFLPSVQEILEEIVPTSFKARLFKCFLDAAVSEQIFRMVAMKGATENASEMIDTLSMQYNRARQTQITSELSEIIGGAAALE
jgi:F-type H+-transporting ATPase subunit gamma